MLSPTVTQNTLSTCPASQWIAAPTIKNTVADWENSTEKISRKNATWHSDRFHEGFCPRWTRILCLYACHRWGVVDLYAPGKMGHLWVSGANCHVQKWLMQIACVNSRWNRLIYHRSHMDCGSAWYCASSVLLSGVQSLAESGWWNWYGDQRPSSELT